ncbi:MAG: sodium:proton antiporter [Microcoleus sp. PH2017_10_PVI_O_A]|uniref:cation:proton antiporter n=1 Tax=unclassified Microcoleus TaxID=2642155 RepID=UPI001D88DFB2|nr:MULTISPECIES: sodium:proton antiporter [unclassified Microcoleus]TAE77606.1 MAG: sodium:proton antiporter [Oscillatoriales cyanobacterium]MCC3408778.1 sodium:proton antiporter [Microcoleus sp. PH2017_10_PVI_O_A]MCC3462917.1 sodium:proton antiporter [Microcoleus sp. PH2017_11_PCY_U_A]MCC3481610.1 sodium:proton antiporter [Microcoleus sp. PH2017_12_PCY_D_A]MCC3527219.1 sodium:proton antiporter [Microcoleus sp. PH2017_21_RUC_O_A]
MVDHYILNLLVIGILLLTVTLGSGWISRLPVSYALIYLIVGIGLGPYGVKLIELRPEAQFLERLTEFVVIVSLFSCGLKMNRPLQLWAWNSTARLIGFLMPISIFAVAAIGHWFVKLDWGPAILLGAILAPTDPVLASEVQLADIDDRDELRFGLTSEGGLNDALAFPFVYFGIYALKDNNWPNWFSQWAAVDLIWAIAAGIVMGILVAKAVTWIDRRLQRYIPADELMEDFIALSTILLTYSLTEVVNGYGFLAVFVAGIVVQRSYRNPEKPLSQLHFTERIEKLMEVGTILILGSMLRQEALVAHGSYALLIGGLLIFLIRPVGTWISTLGSHLHPASRWLCGWFGIRGVGSIYYLTYAFGHGLKGDIGEKIAWITFTTIVLSVILHGISATPLMNWYERRIKPKVPDLI